MTATDGGDRKSVSIPVATLISLIGVVVGGGAGGIVAPARLDARMLDMDKRANELEIKAERILTEQVYLRQAMDKLDAKLDRHLARHDAEQ